MLQNSRVALGMKSAYARIYTIDIWTLCSIQNHRFTVTLHGETFSVVDFNSAGFSKVIPFSKKYLKNMTYLRNLRQRFTCNNCRFVSCKFYAFLCFFGFSVFVFYDWSTDVHLILVTFSLFKLSTIWNVSVVATTTTVTIQIVVLAVVKFH